ncbi:MAG: flavodoxin family protein, partial [Anaerolineae bacterium]|nr:flavodoxin family protein [Anaerolineae bacterium]
MNVLGICGSPHPEGNSAYALNYALNVVKEQGIETTYFSLHDKAIAPCRGCFACRNGDCVQPDEMDEVIEAIRRCDGLILASPVYMGLITGQMKTMMDRTVLFRTGGRFELSGRVGAGIACGGFRNGGQELTLQSMHTFFLQQDMYAIADGPRFSHSGAAIVGRASEDKIGLQTVANLALRVAEAVKRVQAESA